MEPISLALSIHYVDLIFWDCVVPKLTTRVRFPSPAPTFEFVYPTEIYRLFYFIFACVGSVKNNLRNEPLKPTKLSTAFDLAPDN
jgi:hypothetical protein